MIDFSAEGVGAIFNQSFDQFTVVRWKLDIETTPVPLPLLAQVRWIDRLGEHRFRVGLLFVG